MRQCRTIFLVAFAAVLVGDSAFAAVLVDVFAVSATGGATVVDPKTVMFTPDSEGATVTFEFYAIFTTGNGGPSGNNTLTEIKGGMQTIRDALLYSVKGDISPITTPLFTGPWPNGIPTPNAVGDLIIPNTPEASMWHVRAGSQPVAADYGNVIALGSFTFTETGVGPDLDAVTMLNVLPPPASAAGIWKENGKVYSSGTFPPASYAAGAPVQLGVVPEPSTIVLLLTAFVARVLWRRARILRQ